MKVSAIFLTIGIVALSGCSDEPKQFTMPEVNNENCKHENVMKMEPDSLRQKFASLCLRRNSYKPGDKKTWGPGDI